MRRLILKMSMTVDGFVSGPDGQMDWMFPSRSAEGAAWVVDTLWQAGAHVMGSRAYREMVATWPTSDLPFAAPMNQIPKIVFTRGGLDVAAATQGLQGVALREGGESWKTPEIAGGDLAAEIARLKAQAGKDLLVQGGASFARSLTALDLIDEYRLVVHPVVLGRGQALFGGVGAPRHLALVETRAFPGGAMAHVYRRA